MGTTHHATAPAAHRTTAGAARLHHPSTQRAFGKAKILIAAYGALSLAVLMTVAVLAITGHSATSFMWGRSGGVLASAAVLYWLTVLASRGTRWAYLRVRILSVLMPFVITAVDMIPGVCPLWFALAQATCAVPLLGAAFISNGSGLRAALPKTPRS
ncbi:hypothetical protein ACIRPT_13680 [Streptomyces sp. NPDC101227]|uniref:hypothetical protein n=1 Tax=Streptomyces sp. NPDC101227 TaxID=3366136 RepID=UPI003806CC20